MARAQFDFGGFSSLAVANPSQRDASKRAGSPVAAALKASTAPFRFAGGNTDPRREFLDRLGPIRRHFRTDRALEAVDIEETGVEDRVGNIVRSPKMDVARKSLPGLVHETAALVEETAPALIDHDAVRVNQHDGRRALLRGSTGSMWMPSQSPEMPAPCSVPMRISSPVLKRVPGEISFMFPHPARNAPASSRGYPEIHRRQESTASASSIVNPSRCLASTPLTRSPSDHHQAAGR